MDQFGPTGHISEDSINKLSRLVQGREEMFACGGGLGEDLLY